jgi:hypothetical protein
VGSTGKRERDSIQIDFGAHLFFYPMDSGDSFPGGKATGGVKLTIHHVHILTTLIMVEL